MTLLFVVFSPFSVSADSYNYSPLEDVIYSAEAMNVINVVDSSNLTDENHTRIDVEFGALVDVFGLNEKIYLVDKSNNQIHILNSDYQYISSFGENELSSPQGIFVTEEAIYIADTGNLRVAIFNHDYQLISEITAPDDATFKQSADDEDGYDFKPLKITVHKTGRVYVIADQIFEGILDFNPDGSFSRYVGANTVTLSLWEAFWLKFTTEEQRQSQGYRLATTFKNVNIDDMGYLYTVSGLDEGEKVIKKLNYKGIDVLVRNGYIPQNGDRVLLPEDLAVPSGPSEFIDIDVNEYGNYVVLDSVRGRIFTYDFEGNLLYVAGEIETLAEDLNNQRDAFLQPTALTYYQDQVLVVDAMNKNLVVFGYTEFGKLVNQATQYYYDGDYDNARDTWEKVLVLNTNYYLAYSGIAKAELRSGNYEKAMEYAKLGFDDYTYSSAYQPYRYAKLVVVFPYILGFAMTYLVYSFVKNISKNVKRAKEEEDFE
jgi:hypothetical protein